MSAVSTMLPLGTSAPDFKLVDVVSRKYVSLSEFSRKKAVLIIFLCRHCPYVKHVQDELAKIGRDYKDSDLGIIAISANDPVAYPEDSPVSLSEMSKELSFNFPLCFDATQETAKAYTAACTPDFFLFDSARKLVYRGQLDDSRPSNGVPITGYDLRTALDAVLLGKTPDPNQKPSMGCSIKWKAGNEPPYQKT